MADNQMKLAYWMQKAGGRKNAGYTMWKAHKQAVRRGSTPSAPSKRMGPQSTKATAAPKAASSGSSTVGRVAATAASAAAVGAGAFAMARNIKAKEARMTASANKATKAAETREANAAKKANQPTPKGTSPRVRTAAGDARVNSGPTGAQRKVPVTKPDTSAPKPTKPAWRQSPSQVKSAQARANSPKARPINANGSSPRTTPNSYKGDLPSETARTQATQAGFGRRTGGVGGWRGLSSFLTGKIK